jgi:hypothetical protein
LTAARSSSADGAVPATAAASSRANTSTRSWGGSARSRTGTPRCLRHAADTGKPPRPAARPGRHRSFARRLRDAPFATDIAPRNAKATAQGVASANQAVEAAKRLGIGKGSTLFLDVEAYDNTTSACNQPVLSYQSGWNSRLKKLGWKGGLYSAGSSGIASIDFIKETQPDAYTLPRAIWISYADGKPSTSARRFINDVCDVDEPAFGRATTATGGTSGCTSTRSTSRSDMATCG